LIKAYYEQGAGDFIAAPLAAGATSKLAGFSKMKIAGGAGAGGAFIKKNPP
jgi:hypothetical protein